MCRESLKFEYLRCFERLLSFQSICLALDLCKKFNIQGTSCELFEAGVTDKIAAVGWQAFEK